MLPQTYLRPTEQTCENRDKLRDMQNSEVGKVFEEKRSAVTSCAMMSSSALR